MRLDHIERANWLKTWNLHLPDDIGEICGLLLAGLWDFVDEGLLAGGPGADDIVDLLGDRRDVFAHLLSFFFHSLEKCGCVLGVHF